MKTDEESLPPDFVRGDATGLAIPAHAEALREAGEDFLTEAFRAFGSLSADNRVVRITAFDSVARGNSGHKVALTVDYARPEPHLHHELFVKFSRDFSDSFRDRRKYELEAEVRLAQLSRLAAFPVAVPVPHFADFHHESGTGMVIMQRIAFGTGNILPLIPKVMDHELADPRNYYRPIFAALARLAAAHKSGRLSPDVERLFPFDAEAAAADMPIPWTEQQLLEKVAHYAEFARSCPQLLPPNITTPEFIATLERDAPRFLRHEAAVKRFLHANPDFVALCHWNGNIDNAWFWREPDGELQCGLLDWGMVRQMNLAYALWSSPSLSTLELWDQMDGLLSLFIETLHANGGPLLDLDELNLHLNLSVAMLGLALTVDAPTLVLSRMPEAARASGPLDPMLREDSVVHGFLHVFTVFLNLWQTRDFGASLDRLLARQVS